MGMPIELSVYEALTSAGVPPDKARVVERQLESAIQSGHDAIRAEWRDQLMTKADGQQLKADTLKAISDLQRWIITAFLGVAGLTTVLVTAVVKLL
ncbi:hypothetical protein [Comamonas terrigena]|uniref:hypothetical protein n=1 Tax=Comamonas terrigena TaxID=32013 RepID=UPI00244BF699|nr:hypothetical protein [Comamonas terrigena]MDH0051298.1 hypothetical protein [Comamonas terrigena]MDH0513746.1 hypothetical protein [Comamonas terrigena]MDH1093301.1 hypothetical protein [Comamonas terrigena]